MGINPKRKPVVTVRIVRGKQISLAQQLGWHNLWIRLLSEVNQNKPTGDVPFTKGEIKD
jgi:hypothetical protein